MNKLTNLKVGDLVKVTEIDLFIELDDSKAIPQFLVKEKRQKTDGNSVYSIVLLDHIGTDFEAVLVSVEFDGVVDYKLYKQPDFFKRDHRKILQESDCGWLFDFDSYPQEIYSGDIVFKKKYRNEVYGDTCVVEYITDASIIDYELLVLETGFRNVGGGLVEFYEGRIIDEKDVVV